MRYTYLYIGIGIATMIIVTFLIFQYGSTKPSNYMTNLQEQQNQTSNMTQNDSHHHPDPPEKKIFNEQGTRGEGVIREKTPATEILKQESEKNRDRLK